MEQRLTASFEKITSLQNARVKSIRALEMRKMRRETGRFVAEGASLLIAAREAGYVPETIIYLAEAAHSSTVLDYIDWAGSQGSECLPASHAVLAKLSGKENPQTLIAVFHQRWAKIPSSTDMTSQMLWLALEEVRDPGNLGTIIRTVDAVGGAGIMLVGNCCDPFARECVRATMGSIFAVPLLRIPMETFKGWRQEFPGDVVGTALSAKQDFRSVDYRRPLVLLMGSEGPGLSEEAVRLCSQLVKIPMAGRLDSLNLSVATALALYQIQASILRL